MNKLSIYRIMVIAVTAAIIFAGCAKDTGNVRLGSQLTTSQYLNLTSDSVVVVGFVVANNGGFTKEGICLSKDTLPTTADTTFLGGGTQATFNVMVRTSRLTKFHARAFGVNSSGLTFYGTDISFTTPAALPKLAAISSPTVKATQDSGVTVQTAVNITDDGWYNNGTVRLSARGVVFGLSPDPILDSTSAKVAVDKTYKTTEGTAEGKFTSLALNLEGNTTYYLRAYTTNSIGSVYSNVVTFTTPAGYAVINTNPVSNLLQTTVTLNGKYIYNGGTGSPTDQGFVWGTTANPTVTSGNKVSVAQAKDSTITYNLTGLTSLKTYHVRSYVVNSVGINYGADVAFTTLSYKTKFWAVGDYNNWQNVTTADSIVSPVGASVAQGYVYLKAGGVKLVTNQSWDNAHTYGDDGTYTGILSNNNGGNNIKVATSGYYFIQASLASMTYSLTLTTWGLIGDATPGGWSTDSPLTYYSTTGVWGSVVNLVAGGAKFRANGAWTINYGSTAADGVSLDLNGSNIAVANAGTYAIVLNLNAPNAYTYSIATWSVIGDATPGGWSTDTPMTWDAVNNVFSVSVALTAGSLKFRANDAWALNYGGPLTALVPNGSNIPVPNAGTYTVTFNPWTFVGTLTQTGSK